MPDSPCRALAYPGDLWATYRAQSLRRQAVRALRYLRVDGQSAARAHARATAVPG